MPLRRAIHRATLTRLKLLITTMEIWIGACTTAGKPSCGQETDTILARTSTHEPQDTAVYPTRECITELSVPPAPIRAASRSPVAT